jgi:hypothetical protein
MNAKLPKTISLGRLQELLSRDDSDRIAILPGLGVFSEYTVKRFKDRSSMLNHCARTDTGIMGQSWKPLKAKEQ